MRLILFMTVLAGALTGMGCSHHGQGGCPEALDRLVMKRVIQNLRVRTNHLDVWMSGYDPNYWEPRFAIEQADINLMGAALAGLQDRCVVNAYMGWLDFFQNELNEARKELVTKAEKQEMDEVNERWKREQQEAAEYERTHTIPDLGKVTK